jgi:hypothetical protein
MPCCCCMPPTMPATRLQRGLDMTAHSAGMPQAHSAQEARCKRQELYAPILASRVRAFMPQDARQARRMHHLWPFTRLLVVAHTRAHGAREDQGGAGTCKTGSTSQYSISELVMLSQRPLSGAIIILRTASRDLNTQQLSSVLRSVAYTN